MSIPTVIPLTLLYNITPMLKLLTHICTICGPMHDVSLMNYISVAANLAFRSSTLHCVPIAMLFYVHVATVMLFW